LRTFFWVGVVNDEARRLHQHLLNKPRISLPEEFRILAHILPLSPQVGMDTPRLAASRVASETRVLLKGELWIG
jgi:hypothetical protein